MSVILNELFSKEDVFSSIAIGVSPALKEKWTISRQYYTFKVGVSASNSQFFLVRFENRWHEGAVKLGDNAKQITIHPVILKNGEFKYNHKEIMSIKNPVQFISGILRTVQYHHSEYPSTKGYMLYIPDSGFRRISKLAARVLQKTNAMSKLKMDVKVMTFMNGHSATFIYKYHNYVTTTFSGLFKKLEAEYGKDPVLSNTKFLMGTKAVSTIDKSKKSEFLIVDPSKESEFLTQLQNSPAVNKFIETASKASPPADVLSLKIPAEDVFGIPRTKLAIEYEKSNPANNIVSNNTLVNKTFDFAINKFLKDKAYKKGYSVEEFKSGNFSARYELMDEFGKTFVDITDRKSPNLVGHEKIDNYMSNFNRLQESTIQAINNYTGSGYALARDYFIDENIENDRIFFAKEIIGELDKAFNMIGHNLNTDPKLTIFRGMKFEGSNEKNNKFITDYLSKSYLRLQSFTSFSLKPSIAFTFADTHSILSLYSFTSIISKTEKYESNDIYGIEVFKFENSIDMLNHIQSKYGEKFFSFHIIMECSGLENGRFIVPGVKSKFTSEAEIIANRGSYLKQEGTCTLIRKENSGNPIYMVVVPFTFVQASSIIAESDEVKTLGKFMTEAMKVTPKPDNKKSREHQEREDVRQMLERQARRRSELSRHEIDRLEKKYGGLI